MNPVFILATPRSKGSVLARVLGASATIETALALPDDQAADMLARGGWSNRIGAEGWEQAVGSCSRLVRLFPGCRFVVLTRDDDETERSIELTWPLWVPEFGTCGWKVWKKCREMREWHRDFARINPGRCVMLDAAEIGDFASLSAKLGGIVSREEWDAALSVNDTSWRGLRARKGLERPVPAEPRPGQKRERRFPRGTLPNRTMPMGLPPRRGEEIVDGPAYRLPIPQTAQRPVVEVHTIRFGNESWMQECAPTLDAWCKRHGYALTVWGAAPHYPADKFQEVDMLRRFLNGRAEWLLYVDADVIVHPSAPVPEFMGKPGMHVMPDPPIRWVSGAWPGWLKRHFGESPGKWVYRNAGVWACDREAAKRMLEVIREPFVEGQQEQHHFNLWLMKAAERGMPVHDLPPEWNRFPKFAGPGWFFHMAGDKKARKIAQIREAGYLPTRPEPLPEMEKEDRPAAIVYPWRPSTWGAEDLRYSLRSLRRHWLGELPPVLILSAEPPEWLEPGCGVEWRHAPGYTDALLLGLHAAEEIVWMNDDIFLLKDIEPEQLKTPLRYEDLWPKMHGMLANGSKWRKHLARCIRDLHHHGIPYTWNFSTHTPYFYRREEALETLRTFGHRFKIPFETLHFNRIAARSIAGAGLRTPTLPAPEGARYLNYSGEPSPEIREQIEALFPEAAPWEVRFSSP